MACTDDAKPWRLYYWPFVKGRGEYIRLVFEEAGVPYEDVGRGEGGVKAVMDWCWHGGNTGFPACAPPAIERDGFALSNTPVVVSYLGRKYGLHGGTLEDQAHVDQVLAVVLNDAISEGRLAFHPLNFYASHKGQEEASVPFIKQYGEERLPKYMKYFESILGRATPQGDDGVRYLVGDKLTVADLTVYQFLAAAEQHYKQYYDAVDTPLCKALQVHVASRPRVAEYLASNRTPPWDKDSMM